MADFEFEWERRLYGQAVSELKLSNTEIEQMRVLAQNGGPLARLILFFLDSSAELSKHVFNVDLASEAGRVQFLEHQAQYKALQTCAAVLGSCLTPQPKYQEPEQ